MRLGVQETGTVAVEGNPLSAGIHEAAEYGPIDDLRELLADDPGLARMIDDQARTALHLAVASPKKFALEAAEVLLDCGADASARDTNGRTPLHFAVCPRHSEVVDFLLTNEDDLAVKACELVEAKRSGRRLARMDPFRWLKCPHPDCVELLLARHASVNDRDNGGFTPLHFAAAEFPSRVLDLLLSRDADVNAASQQGWTPLHLAVVFGRKQNERRLRNAGANPGLADRHGRTPQVLAPPDPPDTPDGPRSGVKRQGGTKGREQVPEREALLPRIELVRGRLRFGTKESDPLTSIELAFIRCLMQARRRTASYAAIREAVWPKRRARGPRVQQFKLLVRNRVARINRKARVVVEGWETAVTEVYDGEIAISGHGRLITNWGRGTEDLGSGGYCLRISVGKELRLGEK